ncbi:MAG: hypothetical protein U1E62_11915 [Alsobacter sp.]
MKTLIAVVIITLVASEAQAQYYGNRSRNSGTYGGYGTGSNPNSVYVQPHINRNGAYVDGYHRTAPNNTLLDNYGTRGNVNPYNGHVGTRSPYLFNDD